MSTSTVDNDLPLGSPSTTSALRKTFWVDDRRDQQALPNDGDIAEGHIVKVDRDEVLLDIGYKTEVLIPRVSSPSLMTSTPNEVALPVTPLRALVPPEGGQDGLDPGKCAVRAGLGHHREDQGRGRRRHRHRHRGRQGWSHPRHRPARLPAASLVEMSRARPPAVRRQGDRGQDHRARQTATTWSRRVVLGSAECKPRSARPSSRRTRQGQ